MEYLGNGVDTSYKYDEARRWLAEIKTVKAGTTLQNIHYEFDAVGNVVILYKGLPPKYGTSWFSVTLLLVEIYELVMCNCH